MDHVLMLAQRGGLAGGTAIFGGLIFMVLWLSLCILIIAGYWKTYVKAGQPGWGCIIPIYQTYLLTKIAGRPWWWLLLLFIPLVNLVIYIILLIDIAKSFGKDVGFAVGLILLHPIFMCILGFGSAEYQGPAAG